MNIRSLYDSLAPIYRPFITIGSFGAFPGLHARAARELPVSPGSTILDLCCGTGLMLPHLVPKVGPEGRVIGVDFSPRMLEVARKRIRDNKFTNVDLFCSDITEFRPDALVDGVVFSICLSCVPECEKILRTAVTFLKPGSPLILLDAFLNRGKWYYSLTNLQNRVKGRVLGARADNQLREVAAEVLDGLEIGVLHGGLYSLIRGYRPKVAAER